MVCFHVGRSRPGWGKERCKPAWWPAGVPFTDINNAKPRPKRNDLILLLESYRDWNLQDQPEECVNDCHPHDPQIPIPVESTPAAATSRASPREVLINSIGLAPSQ